MPRITEARRQQQRDRILTAARICFQTNGIRGTSMADIIQQSGLSAGAVYGHFNSKDDLIRASIDQSQELLSFITASVSRADGYTSVGDVTASLWAALAKIELGAGVDFRKLAMAGIEQARHDPAVNDELCKRYARIIETLASVEYQFDRPLSKTQTASLIFVFLWGLSVTEDLFGTGSDVTKEALEAFQRLTAKGEATP